MSAMINIHINEFNTDSPFQNCNIYSLKPVNTLEVEMEYENA